MKLFDCLNAIQQADERYGQLAKQKWDSIAKPLGSLGLLEDAVVQICAGTRSITPNIEKRAVVVFCADNGIVAEGVTQTGSEVTAIVAKNLCTADTSVCKMAEVAHCSVVPVDVGMLTEVDHPKMVQASVGKGSNNFKNTVAMTREQAILAIEVGISCAIDLSNKGFQILATGEMGIGNTTTSSAVGSVLLGQSVEKMTGCGAGLSASGVQRKKKIIGDAIAFHQPNAEDPIDVLSKIGGFDIAAMAGLCIGAAYCKKVCIIDGFISGIASLIAAKLNHSVLDYLLASHVSAEPAGQIVLNALGKHPIITANMRLGEGTGAVAVMPLLDMSIAVFNQMATFDAINIDAYTQL